LADRALFESLVRVTVSSKIGHGTLMFKDQHKEIVTMFASEGGKLEYGLHRAASLSFDRLHGLFDLINQPETTAA
jgi:hypothetical protein